MNSQNPYQPTDQVVNQPGFGSSENKNKTPLWAWLFFVACLAIMIATRGGAIWGALGGGLGGVCLKVSQANIPVSARLAICFAITAALWTGIMFLVMSWSG